MTGRQPIIGVAVALVLTLAFWFFLYRPASQEEEAIRAEIATLEQQQDELNNRIRQLEDIRDRAVEIRAAMARLEQYIPLGPAQPAAIRQFQEAADSAGTEIASVTFAQPEVPAPAEGATPADTGTPGHTLANIPVTMVVEGGYFQLVDFFRRLEVEVPRAVLVDSVNVAESETGFPRLRATWGGQVFAIVEAADLVDTTGAPPVAPGATESPSPAPTPTEGGGES